MLTPVSRRSFLNHLGLFSVSSLFSLSTAYKAQASSHFSRVDTASPLTPNSNDTGTYFPVITPGIATLPFEWDGGIKVFRLIAEPVVTQFQDMSDPMGRARRPVYGMGYNGSIIGPTIEAVEGERVRIVVENRLHQPTTVHWHGIHLPIEMDGVPGFSQKPIEPGQSFTYEFPLIQHGTYFYHPHFMGVEQVANGMGGFFIIHPKNPTAQQMVHRDYAYFLQVWMLEPGESTPNVMEMTEFNYFTMNGKPGPDIVPMTAKIGEKVRIRVVNLSMMTHPIHLHGHSFRITENGAGFHPPERQLVANTENISAAEERTFEFTAERPGKWLLHCHFMHHTMNDMHRKPIPGGAGGHAGHASMEMGGMHTWIEIT